MWVVGDIMDEHTMKLADFLGFRPRNSTCMGVYIVDLI